VVICLERFAYGSADATFTRSSLALLKLEWLNFSGAGLPMVSWKRSHTDQPVSWSFR